MNLGKMISETVVCDATEMDPKEVKLIGFMGGYVARSYCTMQKPECEHCQRLLILDEDMETPDFDLNGTLVDIGEYIRMISRGGLKRPTDLTFDICLKAWVAFDAVIKSERSQNFFLKCKKQQRVLVKSVLLLLEEDLEFNELISNTVLELSCQKGHHFAEILVQKFCNCLCKNFVKRKSDSVRDISMETERKKRKFQGHS